MAKPFPTNDPSLRGHDALLNAECDAPNLQITGELQASLSGTLYRNGPNPQSAIRAARPLPLVFGCRHAACIPHAFHLHDGKVSPIFVKRSIDAPEGDGWLLSVIGRGAENRSDLAVQRVRTIDQADRAGALVPSRAGRFPRQLARCVTHTSTATHTRRLPRAF